MVTRLAFVWAAWKMASKRFGPVGGLVVALIALGGFRVLKRALSGRYPKAAEEMEEAAPA